MTLEEQNEFDELSVTVKATGFMSLDTKEKRNRYSELKAKSVEDSSPVTMTKADLQKMIDKSIDAYKEEAKKAFVESDDGLNEAKQIGRWIKAKQVKKENPIANLRVYRADGDSEGGLIVSWKWIRNNEDPDTRKRNVPIYKVTVMYNEELKTVEIPLLDMMQINEFEKVEIIKLVREPLKKVDGFGQKAYNKGGYSFSDPGMFGVKGQQVGDRFEYEVYRDEVNCTVKRPNGKTFEINANYLNQ